MSQKSKAFRSQRELNEAKLEHLIKAVETGNVPPELESAQASLLQKLKDEKDFYESQFFEDEHILKMPSMGAIEISRETLDVPRSLFATDIKTDTLVRICLYEAHVIKATGEVVKDDMLYEVVMSETQLGNVLLNSNSGEGYPVTIETKDGNKVQEYASSLDPSKKQLASLRDKIDSACPQVERFISEIDAFLSEAETKGKATKADIKEVTLKLSYIPEYTVSNNTYDLSNLSKAIYTRINEASLNLHVTANRLMLEQKKD